MPDDKHTECRARGCCSKPSFSLGVQKEMLRSLGFRVVIIIGLIVIMAVMLWRFQRCESAKPGMGEDSPYRHWPKAIDTVCPNGRKLCTRSLVPPPNQMILGAQNRICISSQLADGVLFWRRRVCTIANVSVMKGSQQKAFTCRRASL